MKLLTEFTTLCASPTIVAICAAEGVDRNALTFAVSVSTDDFIALVSLGKSLFAELTAELT